MAASREWEIVLRDLERCMLTITCVQEFLQRLDRIHAYDRHRRWHRDGQASLALLLVDEKQRVNGEF